MIDVAVLGNGARVLTAWRRSQIAANHHAHYLQEFRMLDHEGRITISAKSGVEGSPRMEMVAIAFEGEDAEAMRQWLRSTVGLTCSATDRIMAGQNQGNGLKNASGQQLTDSLTH